MFFRGSRYENVAEAEWADANGRRFPYKKVRFIPRTDGRLGHTVDDGERLDHIAFHYFKNSERFWRICDANQAMWPPDLVAEAGETVTIPSST